MHSGLCKKIEILFSCNRVQRPIFRLKLLQVKSMFQNMLAADASINEVSLLLNNSA